MKGGGLELLKSEVAKCRCRIEIWSTFFAWNQLHITMTFSISTCRKLKFIHRTRSFVTQSQRGLFKNFSIEQDAQHVTGSIFCRVLWPLTPFIFRIKSKSAQNALKFDVHSFYRIQIIKICRSLQRTENILKTFTCPDKWKKLWLKATQMIVNVLCLSARYMEFSKFIEKYDA